MTKSEQLSNIFENDLPYPDKYDVFEPFDDTAAHHNLCPDCKEKILAAYKKSLEEKKASPCGGV